MPPARDRVDSDAAGVTDPGVPARGTENGERDGGRGRREGTEGGRWEPADATLLWVTSASKAQAVG